LNVLVLHHHELKHLGFYQGDEYALDLKSFEFVFGLKQRRAHLKEGLGVDEQTIVNFKFDKARTVEEDLPDGFAVEVLVKILITQSQLLELGVVLDGVHQILEALAIFKPDVVKATGDEVPFVFNPGSKS